MGSAAVCRIKRRLCKRGPQGLTPVQATASMQPQAAPQQPPSSTPPQVAALPTRLLLYEQQKQRTAHLQALCDRTHEQVFARGRPKLS